MATSAAVAEQTAGDGGTSSDSSESGSGSTVDQKTTTTASELHDPWDLVDDDDDIVKWAGTLPLNN